MGINTRNKIINFPNLVEHPVVQSVKAVKIKIIDGSNTDETGGIHSIPSPKIDVIEVGSLEKHNTQTGIKQPYKQTLKVVAKEGAFGSSQSFKIFLNTMFDFNNEYTTYNSTIKLKENEVQDYESGNPLFHQSHGYYNFRIPEYEIQTLGVDEKSLPSFLDGIYKSDFPNSSVAEDRWQVPFRGMADASEYEMLRKMQGPNTNFYMFSSKPDRVQMKNNYFYNYGLLDIPPDAETTNFNKNIFITHNYHMSRTKALSDVPFFNQIVLPRGLDSNHDIKDAIEQWKMEETILYIIRNGMGENLHFGDLNQNPLQEATTLGQSSPHSLIGPRYWAIDILHAIQSIELLDLENSERESYIYNPSRSPYGDDGKIDEGISFMRDFFFIGTIRNLIGEKALTFRNILLEPKQCHTELIAYKIVKSKDQNETQRFYFYNFRKMKHFIDTQIKFGTTYTYDVSAIYFVGGQKYYFEEVEYAEESPTVNPFDRTGQSGLVEKLTSIESDSPSGATDVGQKNTMDVKPTNLTATINYVVKPSYQLIEIPFFTKELIVVEPPPTPPQVRIQDVNGVNNKIRISFRDTMEINNSNSDRKPLVALSSDELPYINRLTKYCYSAYHYDSFQASDSIFEVFRLEQEPTSVADFGGNRIYTIASGHVDNFGKRKPFHYVFDFLEHQKKYYYLFRTRTHFGNPSNPSSIYTVEKYKDADETILKIGIWRPKDEPSFYENKFRRFMQISVNPQQFQIHPLSYQNMASKDLNPLILGMVEEDTVWNYGNNNHIKLRLESTKSGKKIDFNLYFKYNSNPE